jgi:23S rRNA pseudoU1915 N3-methylase RlmH
MKAKLICGLAVLVLLTSLAAADDPWVKRPPQDWNRSDVDKVMKDSPWGKEIATEQTYSKDSAENKSTGGKQLDPVTDRGAMQDTAFAMVLWWSAKTTRRAYIRMAELSGAQFAEEQKQKFAESPMSHHVVSVIGGGEMVNVSAKIEAAELKKAAWLESARLKKKILPEDVVVVMDEKGKAQQINFLFARELEGQALVTAEDKKLIFKFKLPKSAKETVEKARQFDVTFQPAKMVAGGAADF